MSNAFEVKNVVKSFGEVMALKDVTLAAEEGKIFGLLGPNGAGKTTLVNLLSTLLEPNEGTVKVLGIDAVKHPEKVRENIGLAGQFAAVDEFLTGMENIYMTGRLYHLDHKTARKRSIEILEKLNLLDVANRTVKTYSGGMRRRLDLGASLVGQPKVLFLDEPTTGLDPRTRLDLWDIIRELLAGGTTILLTTQYLEEADELADKIAVLDHGKVIAEGTSDQLKTRLGGDVIEFRLTNEADRDKAIEAVKSLVAKPPVYDPVNMQVSLPVKEGSQMMAEVVRVLDKANIVPASFSMHRPSLDDVFLSLTGKKTDKVASKPAKRGRR